MQPTDDSAKKAAYEAELSSLRARQSQSDFSAEDRARLDLLTQHESEFASVNASNSFVTVPPTQNPPMQNNAGTTEPSTATTVNRDVKTDSAATNAADVANAAQNTPVAPTPPEPENPDVPNIVDGKITYTGRTDMERAAGINPGGSGTQAVDGKRPAIVVFQTVIDGGEKLQLIELDTLDEAKGIVQAIRNNIETHNMGTKLVDGDKTYFILPSSYNAAAVATAFIEIDIDEVT